MPTANVVDGYYQEMNVHVVLVNVELWLERDYFQTGFTCTKTLGSFTAYRRNQIRQDPTPTAILQMLFMLFTV